jgi:PAS domain S-box-containing protein
MFSPYGSTFDDAGKAPWIYERHAFRRFGIVVLSIIIATVLRMLLQPLLGNEYPFATYYIVIIIAASYGDFWSAMLAVFLGVIAAALLFLPPVYSGSLDVPNLTGLTLLVITGIATALVSESLRHASRRVEASKSVLEKDRNSLFAILQNLPEAVIATDERGCVIFMNPAAEDLLGTSESEAKFLDINRLLHLIDAPTRARVEEPARKAMLECVSSIDANDFLLVSKAGREIPVSKSRVPIKDRSGNITGAVLVFHDLTKQKQEEERLRASQAQLAGIVATALDAIITVDEEQRIVLFNAAAEAMFGCTAAEAERHSLDYFIPDRFRSKHRQYIQSLVEASDTKLWMGRLPIYGLRANGEEFPLESSISQIEVGGQKFYTVILRDIGERTRWEDSLRIAMLVSERNRAQLEAVFHSVSDGIFVSDMAGNILLVNEGAARIYGYESAEELQRDFASFREVYELHYPDGRQMPFDEWPLSRVRRGDSILNGELHVRRRDTGKEWYFSVSGEPVRNEQGDQVLAVVVTCDITERRQAELERHRQERLLKLVIDGAPARISYIDSEQCYQFANKECQEWFGHSREEMRGKHLRDVIGTDAYEGARTHIEAALRGERVTFEQWIDYGFASECYVKVDFVPHVDAHGNVEGFLALVLDLTERRRVSEALRESEMLNRAILSSLNTHVSVLNRHGEIIMVNRSWAEFAVENGANSEALVGPGVNYLEICQRAVNTGDQLALEAMEGIKAVCQGSREFFELEYPCHSPTEQRWFLMLVTPLKSSEGGAVIAHNDITRCKQVEAALRNSEEKNRSLLENIPDYVTMVDRKGTLLYINHIAQGSEKLELIGTDIFSLLDNKSREFAHKCLEQAFLTGETCDLEITDRNSRVFHNRFVPFKGDGQVDWVLSVATDITEQKRAELARSNLAERLELAREDERRSLALRLHDDTGQDMVAATIRLQLLEQKLAALLPPESPILVEVNSLEKLVRSSQRSIRQMAHVLHPYVLERFGLCEALRSFTQELGAFTQPSSATISLDIASDFPRLDLKVETTLYRIVQEAVTNSLKHSGADSISLRLHKKGKLAVIIVEDNGRGFKEMKIKSECGIGLASIRERAKLIGAVLNITSRDEKGTKVVLTLSPERCVPKSDPPLSMTLA